MYPDESGNSSPNDNFENHKQLKHQYNFVKKLSGKTEKTETVDTSNQAFDRLNNSFSNYLDYLFHSQDATNEFDRNDWLLFMICVNEFFC